MRRIALVTPILPVSYDQTRGRYIHEIARCLARIAQVRVFFQMPRYPSLPGLAPRSSLHGCVGSDYQLEDVDVEAYTYPALPGLSRALNGIVSSLALTPRVRRFRPDVLLAYWIYPDGYAALRAARRLGIPCVIGALGSDIHVRSGVNVRFTRSTIAGADALITVSEAMRQAAISQFGAAPDRVQTIVNGFNTSVFHPRPQAPLRAALGIPSEAELIVYVGRFVEAKGMRELLAAFTRLAAASPRRMLALVGDGVMREELAARVTASGLSDRIRLPGGLPPDQVAQWICASDVLTLPSWSEGYPNVVVEAVACGRPVVATDVGGTREILNETNGILVPPRDIDALAQALARALTAPWDHGAIAAAMRRGWSDVARETLEVCERVIAQRPSR
jgi:teichuronic acid biosynthesis glycosyltransferase TuaC